MAFETTPLVSFSGSNVQIFTRSAQHRIGQQTQDATLNLLIKIPHGEMSSDIELILLDEAQQILEDEA